jgi:hypothetical protein
MSERFNLFVKLKYASGRIDPRYLLIADIATREEAERFAHNAVVYNPGVVLAAWIEPAPKESNQ